MLVEWLVDERKIRDYLLSPSHPAGKAKAKFFQSFGFKREEWCVLADALRLHAQTRAACTTIDTAYGLKYVVEGPLTTPDHRVPWICSIWFVERGESQARFVTAYPLAKKGAADDRRTG